MSYENEIQTYILELEKTVEELQKETSKLRIELDKSKRIISILDSQQQHVDL